MGVKASYGMGLKTAQAWGCPKAHGPSNVYSKTYGVSSDPFPPSYLYLCLHKKLEISRQIQMCSTNRRDLPHSAPFPFIVGVDS
jgi:hypothetical protein